jgi:hypothetical protein
MGQILSIWKVTGRPGQPRTLVRHRITPLLKGASWLMAAGILEGVFFSPENMTTMSKGTSFAITSALVVYPEAEM